MKIIKLMIENNRRFLNKGTRSITYTPQSATQLIIGNNGFGKSSLLWELSPLPGANSDYIKGGKKEIHIEHRGSLYTLISDFIKGNHHCFIKDGVELNTGGTLTVQKQLVEEHFNYTPDIHNLILGKNKFTDMSPQKRREWFTKMCSVDMSFVVNIYKNVLQEQRNNQGAIKHVERKISEHAGKILSEEEFTLLQTQAEDAKALARQLLEIKDTKLQWSEQQEQELVSKLTFLHTTAMSVLDNDLLVPAMGCDVQELEKTITDLKNSQIETNAKLSSAKKEFDSLNELLNDHSSDEYTDEELKQTKVQQEQRYHALLQSIRWEKCNEPRQSFADLSSIKDILVSIFNTISVNQDFAVYTKRTVIEKREKLDTILKEISRLENKIEHNISRLQELEDHRNQQECPDCGYKWIPGLSEKEVVNLKAQVIQQTDVLESMMPHQQELIAWIEAFDEWKGLYVQYCNLVSAYPRLTLFWNKCVDDLTLFNNPKSLAWLIDQFLDDLKYQAELEDVIAELQFVTHALQLREKGEVRNKKLLKGKALELENTISHLIDQTAIIKSALVKEERLYVILTECIDIVYLIQNVTKDIEKAIQLKHGAHKNYIIDHKTSALLSDIADMSEKIGGSSQRMLLMEELKSSKQVLDQEIDLFALLDEALSPSTGLIAETLGGFIRSFISQMNDVTKHIWSTPLIVEPCHSENGDLNYKFPVHYQDIANPITDISLGSTGEQEMINFAFVIVSMVYLEMEDYSLAMDEVGHSFHEHHRSALYNFVKMLIESARLRQVFIVSHFSQTHGSLTHADINVVDPTGVLITADSNKHFKIE